MTLPHLRVQIRYAASEIRTLASLVAPAFGMRCNGLAPSVRLGPLRFLKLTK